MAFDEQDELKQLRADPRLKIPLDGPGSHRIDLAELRILQAEVRRLQAQLDATRSINEQLMRGNDKLEEELARLEAKMMEMP